MYKVLMRDNKTKQEKLVSLNLEWHEASKFWWTEGNFACDCNREEVFYDVENDNTECGNSRFIAIYAELETGEKVYLDVQ
jgi:hypothetical protein